jgi:glycosyltransferase involved in cell wall biosynthesis
MNSSNSLSVLIPAHNEDVTLHSLTSDIIKILTIKSINNTIFSFEVIILNDGSSDETASVVRNLERQFSCVKFIENAKPSGIASAFQTLYDSANSDWIILAPGDAQWPPEAISLMIDQWIKLDFKSAINSIRTNKNAIYGFHRRLLSSGYSAFGSWIVGDPVDPGSIKIIPTESVRSDSLFKSVVSEVQVLQRSKKLTNSKVISIPTPWSPRAGGKSNGANLKTVLPALKDAVFMLFVNFFTSKR